MELIDTKFDLKAKLQTQLCRVSIQCMLTQLLNFNKRVTNALTALRPAGGVSVPQSAKGWNSGKKVPRPHTPSEQIPRLFLANLFR